MAVVALHVSQDKHATMAGVFKTYHIIVDFSKVSIQHANISVDTGFTWVNTGIQPTAVLSADPVQDVTRDKYDLGTSLMHHSSS